MLPQVRSGTHLGQGEHKRGCLAYERDPRTIYDPVIEDSQWSFSPPADWAAIVEFYCPRCGIMIENELLPLGHPLTYDMELDLEKLKLKHRAGEQQ